MKQIMRVLLLSALLTSIIGAATSQALTFEIFSDRTKIGDAIGVPTYGPGFHNMVADGNSLYIAYSSDGYNTPEILVGSSLDNGSTWEVSSVVARNPNIDPTGAAVAVGPDPQNPGSKLIHVVWGERNYSATPSSTIYYSRAQLPLTAVRTSPWSAPVAISGPYETATYSRNIAVDGTGKVHIVFNGNSGDSCGSNTFYTSSMDGGITFDAISSLSCPSAIPGGEPSIVADALGNAYVTWLSGKFMWNDIYFTKKSAGTSSWTTPVIVNGPTLGYFESLAVFNPSTMYIAWMAPGQTPVNGSPNQGIYLAKTTDGGVTWTQNRVLEDAPGQDMSIAVDSAGVISLAYPCNDNVCMTRSTNNGNRWSTPSIIATNADAWPNIVVEGTGKVGLAFPGKRGGLYFTREK